MDCAFANASTALMPTLPLESERRQDRATFRFLEAHPWESPPMLEHVAGSAMFENLCRP